MRLLLGNIYIQMWNNICDPHFTYIVMLLFTHIFGATFKTEQETVISNVDLQNETARKP